jgi:hypothetical protein
MVDLHSYTAPSWDQSKRVAAGDALVQMTDDELDEHLTFQMSQPEYGRSAEYEPCLIEMMRRGMVDCLRARYDELMANCAGATGPDFPANLELLTALRRTEGKRDPLTVRLELSSDPASAWSFQPPLVHVKLENVDEDREAVRVRRNTSGESKRCKFVLTDEFGRQVADSNFPCCIDGCGMSQPGSLNYGSEEPIGGRDLRQYLAAPASGKYQLQAFYHANGTIARERDLASRIVLMSKPISVIVANYERRPTRQAWFEIPRPLSVLMACLALAALSISVPRSTAVETSAGPQKQRFPGIAQRDFWWGVAVTCLAIAMWLNDPSFKLHRLPAGVYPDATAKWSIRLADEVRP